MSRRLLCVLRGVAVLFLALAASSAQAGLICDDPADGAPFNTALSLKAFFAERGIDPVTDRIALAQGRSGNNRLTGDWEVGLSVGGATADGPVDGGAQYRWAKSADSSWVPFSLVRKGDALSFTVGKTVTSDIDPLIRGITALALFTSAGREDDEVRVENLSLNGVRLREVELSAGDGRAGSTVIEKLPGDFLLAGEVRMRWEDGLDGRDPNRLMLQIAGYGTPSPGVILTSGSGVGSVATAIPEPSTAVVLLTGVLGLIGQRHMRCASLARAVAARHS